MPVFESFGSLDFLQIFPIILFFVSLFGLITTNNMIKSIIYVTILNTAVITFWIIVGSEGLARVAPPITDGIIFDIYHPYYGLMSDPLPQALMITAIVIGFSVTAVAIVILITTYRKYQTTDWRVLFELIRKEAGGYITIPTADPPNAIETKEEKPEEKEEK